MVTFVQAVPNPGANNFAYFSTQMVKGIYSNYMKQRVIEAGVLNEAQLLQVMVSTVANAMEAYTLNTWSVSNLDGLYSTTIFKAQGQCGDEPMEINRIGNDKCFNCDSKGHHTKDCPKLNRERWTRDTMDHARDSSDKKIVVCNFYDFKRHYVSICRKKKQYKEDQKKAAFAKRDSTPTRS